MAISSNHSSKGGFDFEVLQGYPTENKKGSEFSYESKNLGIPGLGGSAKEIDPKTIDWSTVAAANLTYRFKQDPGAQNALGRIKFMFPNKFNVYLHDTPSKELFAKVRRDSSSGCIRVEKPVDLTGY